MQQFKKGEKVDFAKSEKEVYEKYKHALKVNAHKFMIFRLLVSSYS
jgi:putative transposase